MGKKSRADTGGGTMPPAVERSLVTVVGIGNEFRGDDAVGLKVSGRLKGNMPAGARTVELTGDQSYLLELMRSTNAMIIIDAVQSSAPAGTIFRVDVSKEPAPRDFLSFSTHAFDSIGAIEMGRTLGILPPFVLIYGIVGRDFSFKNSLTPEVEEAIEVIQEKIISDLETMLAGCSAEK